MKILPVLLTAVLLSAPLTAQLLPAQQEKKNPSFFTKSEPFFDLSKKLDEYAQKARPVNEFHSKLNAAIKGNFYGFASNLPQDKTLPLRLNDIFTKNKIAAQFKIATYKQMDIYAMDKRSGSLYTYTYRPLIGECAALTYIICKDFSNYYNADFNGWKIVRVFEIEAKPKAKAVLLNAQGKEKFSKNGNEYPAWDYHRAAMLALQKGDDFTLIILDNFLADTPLQLKDWLAKFDLKSTQFKPIVFSPSEAIEAEIKSIDAKEAQLVRQNKPLRIGGDTYNPHIIRK